MWGSICKGALMLNKKFSEILLELNIINKDQLQECLQEKEKTGKLLEQILIEKKLATKDVIAKALAKEVGFVFIDKITEQMVNPELLGKIPLKFLRQHMVIPVVFESKKTIITANPRDLQPLDDVSLLISGDVKYGVASESIINAAINKYYPMETSKEMMEELKEESEDEIDLALTIGERLKKEGFEVVVAEDGVAAMDAISASRVDLVIMDIMMPNMDGFSFAAIVKSRHETENVPIVVLTARSDEETRRRCKDLGVSAYVVKPYDPNILLNEIKKQIGNK